MKEHIEKEEHKKAKLMVNVFLFFIMLGITIWLGKEILLNEKNLREKEYNAQELYNGTKIQSEKELENQIDNNNNKQEEQNNINIPKEKSYPKEEIIKEYKGYSVGAKLEIPVINLETYVLENYSIQGLNISVTKFWGANPNEIGNYCIAGHNFQNKNMFRNIKKLKNGDILTITNNSIGKIEYEVYDLYKVVPNDVSCLSQDTKGKREVTLITCTNDSAKRIIVKAREVGNS